MTTATRLLGLLAALALASAATLAQAAPQLQISPLSYQLTQLQPVPGNPRALDVTSRVGVVNVGDRALDVKAHLVSTSSNLATCRASSTSSRADESQRVSRKACRTAMGRRGAS